MTRSVSCSCTDNYDRQCDVVCTDNYYDIQCYVIVARTTMTRSVSCSRCTDNYDIQCDVVCTDNYDMQCELVVVVAQTTTTLSVMLSARTTTTTLSVMLSLHGQLRYAV